MTSGTRSSESHETAMVEREGEDLFVDRPNILPPNAVSDSNLAGQPSPILRNFILMSILFSANHGCVVACLSLATARLGSLGAYQSGLL